MIDDAILAQAEALLQRCREAGLTVATAESCTGGLIAASLTAIAGSSDVVERGFITYSNQAKTDLVGVPAALIAAVGAVSEDVARGMAEGTIARTPADLAVSVTGVAGPGGGSAEKPVGLVWFGCARRGHPTRTLRRIFPGDRTAIRRAAVAQALDLLECAI
ncbi:CinA family protein [Limobrevibacterium gyesilva]|uniref:CinA family protein n=1 Tax=Limobrevibacterium gyesilva TaxID=2991712 RepID=A0AA41YL75_9PROT|nr:CinA family protein [Limobrevibacterium gyesilva]MCW3475464.1 CinA family protein [Limobrevibacterium gyesilva]